MRSYKVNLFLLLLIISIQPLHVYSQQKATKKHPYIELINTKTSKKIVIDSGSHVRVKARSSDAKKTNWKIVKARVTSIGNHTIQFTPKRDKYQSITYSYTNSPDYDVLSYIEITTPGSVLEGAIVNGFIVAGLVVVAVIVFIPVMILTGGNPDLLFSGLGGKPMRWHSFRKRINLTPDSDWMIHVVTY